MNQSRDWRELSNAEFKAITQKGEGELFLISKYVYRPLTTFVTQLYARVGLGANAATIHSVVAALTGAGALLWPRPQTFVATAAALQLYFVLDHVDGELARLRRWCLGEPQSLVGEYLDAWAHFHSVNLVFATLGIGLTLRDGNVLWAILGLVADNGLGNFPRLALAQTLWSGYARLPTIVDHPSFRATLASLTEGPDLAASSQHWRQLSSAKRLAQELILFPGNVVSLSVVLSTDALISLFGQTFSTPSSYTYLVVFAAVALVSKIRRTIISMHQLRQLSLADR